MQPQSVDVLVLGCGIIGLTTALTILHNNQSNNSIFYNVSIFAKDFPPNTTSNKAAALWFPYLASPPELICKWSAETRERYLREIQQREQQKLPFNGLMVRKVIELYKKVQEEVLPYWNIVAECRRTTPEELPNDTYKDGYAIDQGVVIDTDVYLDFLLNQAKEQGITFLRHEVQNVHETFDTFDVVINCTGLGSRDLFQDESIFPTRGQTVIVKSKGDTDVVMDDDEALAYVVPRLNTTVLGSTKQQNNWNLHPDDNDTKDILENVKALRPAYVDVEILQVKVGLRPTRPTIRLEPQWYMDGKKLVIHNYGHGGSGFTVCWGCAAEVFDLIGKHAGKFVR